MKYATAIMPGEDKRGNAGEEPKDYENAADKFQRAGEAHELSRVQRHP